MDFNTRHPFMLSAAGARRPMEGTRRPSVDRSIQLPDGGPIVFIDERDEGVPFCCRLMNIYPLSVRVPATQDTVATMPLLESASPVEQSITEQQKQSSEDGWACAICLGTLVDPMQLPCEHKYCSHCLEEYDRLTGDGKCPICRGFTPVVVAVPTAILGQGIVGRLDVEAMLRQSTIDREQGETGEYEMIQVGKKCELICCKGLGFRIDQCKPRIWLWIAIALVLFGYAVKYGDLPQTQLLAFALVIAVSVGVPIVKMIMPDRDTVMEGQLIRSRGPAFMQGDSD